ncbi:hypothetical protein N6L24_05775 [Cognatishimia sp. SS12]|uniref:hypothetical protein n=1 Tax=Cognatishimia sp. SS12 TaxID=2979465 RepID=UPI00232BDADC|nr:hypothetical protein [Cognatishimia sp. SS12]MDC0737779.1 hypothetical protein [Cognatishimia sp. SS12]
MAKADKTDTSSEDEKSEQSKAPQPPKDEILDAEVVEETPGPSADDAADDTPSADTDAAQPDQDDAAAKVVDDPSSEDLSEAGASFVMVDIPETERETEAETDTEDAATQETAADADPESDVVPAPIPPVSEAPQTVKKTGFVPVFLGGVVAAALGFGAAQYIGPLFEQPDEQVTALEATLTAQSAQLESVLTQQSDLMAQLEAARGQATQTTASIEGLTASVAAVNDRIDDAAEALVTLDGRLTALEKRPITQGLPSSAIDAYERELEALKASVAAQREEAANMEANAKLTAQQALARAALSRVLAALDSGAPYRTALADFTGATGRTAPDALAEHADTGVPTLAELQAAYPPAARAALAAARQAAPDADDGNRVTSFLRAQLGARSVTPQDGEGADAILSRAEDALRAGRVTDALAELARLPEAAQPALADWQSQAQSRQEAFAAGDALSQDLNAN